tara:strand:+ start:325 stop:609 length:285 start_codon:yes stop_codon:yes gene_type:complete
MDKEYAFSCRGCHKPDKDYWYDDEMDGANKIVSRDDFPFNTPTVEFHKWSRADVYGIFTGLYCDKCYDDSNIYTYRKDEYHDEGYAGEQLYPDE